MTTRRGFLGAVTAALAAVGIGRKAEAEPVAMLDFYKDHASERRLPGHLKRRRAMDAFCFIPSSRHPGSRGHLHALWSGEPFPEGFKAGWVAYTIGRDARGRSVWSIRWADRPKEGTFWFLALGEMMERHRVETGSRMPRVVPVPSTFTQYEAVEVLVEAKNRPRVGGMAAVRFYPGDRWAMRVAGLA